MHKLKSYFAVFVGLLIAGAAVALHVLYAWPEGLQSLSKGELDLVIMEPLVETCAVFFIVLRRSASFVGRRLGVIGQGEELIQDTHGNTQLAEIMASVLVIMFRWVYRIHPGPAALTDHIMVALAIVNLLLNIYEAATRGKDRAA